MSHCLKAKHYIWFISITHKIGNEKDQNACDLPRETADCSGTSITISLRLCTYLILSKIGIKKFRPCKEIKYLKCKWFKYTQAIHGEKMITHWFQDSVETAHPLHYPSLLLGYKQNYSVHRKAGRPSLLSLSPPQRRHCLTRMLYTEERQNAMRCGI